MKKINRKFTGVVISNKMNKTVNVLVNKVKKNPIYKKRYVVGIKFLAHDENNLCQPGDKVMIAECRPLSKKKRWQVISTNQKSSAPEQVRYGAGNKST